jgi:hypothetical protein
MEKPYELKALGEKIVAHAKENGLTIAEEAVEVLGLAVYQGVKQWLKESADLSSTPIDNLILPVLNYFDGHVKEQIDKAVDLDKDGD